MATSEFVNLATVPSPAGSPSIKQTAPHTRSYQACIPCRSRKVKCNLGSVDSPHDPPCQRCKREQKECYFSSTRRKRKLDERAEASEAADLDAYEKRNSRKRIRDSADDGSVTYQQPVQHQPADPAFAPRPLTPGGSVGRAKPLRRPSSRASSAASEDDPQINDDTAALLQKTELYNPHDALNLLYEAAGQTGDLARYNSNTLRADGPIARGAYGSGSAVSAHGRNNDAGFSDMQEDGPRSSQHKIIQSIQQPGLSDALQAWSKLRFVRGQWFTATEGISYIDYFYRFLCPLTPITIPNFRDPSTHATLLSDEPMLAVTILTLSSRYMALPGPGGKSRSFAIHDKLWKYLQAMIDRLLWGQEHFGGGLGGPGFQIGDSEPPGRSKGLRTLGTVESLLILTEWHTRALHFPPGDDNNELLVESDVGPTLTTDADASSRGGRIDSWLEPCWRSDRMCWSLLANAKAIAYELGVFNVPSHYASPAHTRPAYRKRAENIRRLLFIYITQTSGRLSLPSMLPEEHCKDLFPQSQAEAGNFAVPQVFPNGIEDRGNDVAQEATLYYWCTIAKLFKEGNHELFRSRQFTRDFIASGRYVDRLEILHAKLRKWKEEFDSCSLIPQLMRHILHIEYYYARVYMNTVALQAIVDRCTQNARSDSANNSPSQNRIIPPQTLATWLEGDRRFIKDIVSESQSLLRIVIEGLLPQEYLKFAPVRTYFRIVTVSIFLLKTFAVGASEADVNLSLGLLGRVTAALTTCIVDDVHVGNRHAELLRSLTNRVKARIIRITAKQGHKSTIGKARRHSGMRVSQSNQQVQQGSQPTPQDVTYPFDQRQQQDPWNNSMQKQANPALYRWPSAGPPSSSKAPWSPSLDPMQGISLSTYDFDFHNPSSSIMPPPTFSFDNPTSMAGGGEYVLGAEDSPTSYHHRHSSIQSDWFALPLDPLINFNDGDVRNIGYGPDLSGNDMLEVLLGEPTSYDDDVHGGVNGGYGGEGLGTMYGPISGGAKGLGHSSR